MHNQSRQARSRPASELEQVGQQLAEWRRTHKAPSPIPEELWTKAAGLAAREGVCAVARALRLNYAVLKRRVMTAPAAAPTATFFELLPPVAGSIGECALEVESRGGVRMRVVMKNVAPLGLACILRDFAG